MLTLIRLVFYAAVIYLFYLLAFPQWQGQVYHVASLSIVFGGAVGVFLFLKVYELSTFLGRLLIELGFALVVALYFGSTMPQRSGKPPLQQWSEGHRPTQSDARDGVSRLGINPNSKPAEWVISLFPAH